MTTQLKIQEIFLDSKKKMIQSKTIIRYIRNLFEQEKEDYYKPVRVGKFWSRNCIEYESTLDFFYKQLRILSRILELLNWLLKFFLCHPKVRLKKVKKVKKEVRLLV